MSRSQSELFPWEEPETEVSSKEAPGAPPTAADVAADADAVENEAPSAASQDGIGGQADGANAGAGTVDDAIDGDTQETIERVDDEPLAGLESYLERVPGRERLIAPKEYYSISEVCELVGLKPHVLRYWETQFAVLNPSKNRSGNRVYQRKEIRLVMLVKHLLYEEKYTVEGAKQRIEQMRRGGDLRDATSHAMSEEALTLLKEDLRQLLRILKPSSDG